MVIASLIGFVRKSKSDNALKLSVSVDAFENAERYTSSKGGEYVSLVLRLSKLWDLINGRREVISLNQILDGDKADPELNARVGAVAKDSSRREIVISFDPNEISIDDIHSILNELSVPGMNIIISQNHYLSEREVELMNALAGLQQHVTDVPDLLKDDDGSLELALREANRALGNQ